MKRNVYVALILAFVIGLIYPQSALAKKQAFSFSKSTSWFYFSAIDITAPIKHKVVRDSKAGESMVASENSQIRYLVWNPKTDRIEATSKPKNDPHYHWTFDPTTYRLYNRAKGAEYPVSTVEFYKEGWGYEAGFAEKSKISWEPYNRRIGTPKGKMQNYIAKILRDKLYFDFRFHDESSQYEFRAHPIEMSMLPFEYKQKAADQAERMNKEIINEVRANFRNHEYAMSDLKSKAIKVYDVNFSNKKSLEELVAYAQECAKSRKVSYADGYYNIGSYTGSRALYLNYPFQNYSQPFESCIGHPISKRTYKLSKNKWIITYDEQIQTDCKFDDQGHPITPDQSLVRYVYGSYDDYIYNGEEPLKLGTSDTVYELYGGFEAKAKLTCSRRMYQTPRRSGKKNMYGQSYARTGNDADPFAPWRIVQKATFQVDINDFLRQLPKGYGYLYLLYYAHRNRYIGEDLCAAIYKLYSKELYAALNPTCKELLQQNKVKEAFEQACIFGDDEVIIEACNKMFAECKNADELFDTFIYTYRHIYKRGLDDSELPHVAFDGLLTNGNYKFFKERSVRFFEKFIAKRNECLADISNIPFGNQRYTNGLYTYIKANMENTYEENYYKSLYSCQNAEFVAWSKEYLTKEAILKLYQLQTVFLENRDIDAFVEGAEKIVKLFEAGYLIKNDSYNKALGELVKSINYETNCWLCDNIKTFDITTCYGRAKKIETMSYKLLNRLPEQYTKAANKMSIILIEKIDDLLMNFDSAWFADQSGNFSWERTLKAHKALDLISKLNSTTGLQNSLVSPKIQNQIDRRIDAYNICHEIANGTSADQMYQKYVERFGYKCLYLKKINSYKVEIAKEKKKGAKQNKR